MHVEREQTENRKKIPKPNNKCKLFRPYST